MNYSAIYIFAQEGVCFTMSFKYNIVQHLITLQECAIIGTKIYIKWGLRPVVYIVCLEESA